MNTKMSRLTALVVGLAFTAATHSVGVAANVPPIRAVDIGHGIVLHYAEAGRGTPIIFVHGSLSDGGYWIAQVGYFSKHYRAITYSRRYSFPNRNPSKPGYSAKVDADDLAAFIEKLHLGRVDIIGHSYGALTALFLASKYPSLVRRLVLCEAPAVSLLNDIEGPEHASGRAMYADIQRRMVAPMKAAFRSGADERGVRTFIDYVLRDPRAWDNMTSSSHRETMRDVREWDVMMTSGHLFPPITPSAIRRIEAPTLILSGANSYPFLGVIDRELARLLPHNHRIVISGAGHQMWYDQTNVCRRAVDAFLGWAPAAVRPYGRMR